MSNKLFNKIRLVLIKEWNMNPIQFDELQKAGKILLRDAYGAMETAMMTDPIKAKALLHHLYGDKIAKMEKLEQQRQQRIQELTQYKQMLITCPARNEVEKERIKINIEKCDAELEMLGGG